MSPARPSSRRNSSGGFKPYTRGAAQSVNVTPIMVLSNSGSVPRNGSTSFSSPVASPTDPNPPVQLLHNANSPPHTPQLNAHQSLHSTQHLNVNTPHHAAPPHIVERPGFPTYAQYKQVETAYLRSLTPRRQGKALISQRMFDRIWDVLHQPESPGETAQFRFWARKMFTVRTVPGVPRGAASGGMGNGSTGDLPSGHPETQEVLLHDNLLVAIQEQLYDLLCYCHGSTGHGGRDKTCALIRKHYTWVPKDLVSSFIKTCPTCILKKCGGGGVSMTMNLNANAGQQQRQMQQIQERQEEHHEHQRLQMHHTHQDAGLPLPGMRDFFQNMYGMDLGVPAPSAHHQLHPHGIPWPTMGGSGSPSDLPMSPMGMSLSMSLSMSGSGSGNGNGSADSGSGTASGTKHGPNSTPGSGSSSGSGSTHEDDSLALENDHETAYRDGKPHLHGRGAVLAYPAPHPMVREVALYKGLPNGWQYRHTDYASAHAEFMAAKTAGALSGGLGVGHGMQMHLDVDGHGVQRPRVPSILPLWGPDKFAQSEYEAIAAGNAEQLQGLSPVLPGNGALDSNTEAHANGDVSESSPNPATHPPGHFTGGAQQMSLQYLLMNTPKDDANTRPYTPQIDPVLLGYPAADPPAATSGTSTTVAMAGSGSGPGTESSSSSGSTSVSGARANPEAATSASLTPSSPSVKRAPLRIHLDFPPPEKSFQALLAYRDSLGEGSLTPDSPLLGWGPGSAAGAGAGDARADGTVPSSSASGTPSLVYPASPSPSLSAGSGGSGLSQLSRAFHVHLTADTTTTSADSTPASSALPTPVDEQDTNELGRPTASADIKGKRKMDAESEAEARTRLELEKELSEGIQIVLGLHAQREMTSEA